MRLLLVLLVACGSSAQTNPDAAKSPGDGAGGGARDGAITASGWTCSRPPAEDNAPELPRVSIDTTLPAVTGKSTMVKAGDDLQAALDAAMPGDELVLEAGAIFTGTFTLAEKQGSGWITVRSSQVESLPAPNTRVTPADAVHMPVIVGTNSPVIALQTAPRAHHFRFIGIEFRPAAGQFATALIRLGSDSETDVANQAHDLVFDRCYIHGDPTVGGRRGLFLNSGTTAVIDSWLSDWKEVGADSQAINGVNGPGPYRIVNNYLEGAGENILFGGSDSTIQDLVPSDLEICHNHFTKPLSWKVDDPTYAGTHWEVKNCFELKVGRRVLFADNVVEHCWPDAQTGRAINIKSADQGGTAPWSVTEQVTLINNWVRDAASGAVIEGQDPNTQLWTNHVRIYNNLFTGIGTGIYAGEGNLFAMPNHVAYLLLSHNTGFAPSMTIAVDQGPWIGFVFRDNIVDHGVYGVKGNSTAEGNPTFAAFFTAPVFATSVLIGYPAASYPTGNSFPATVGDVGFVGASDYHLAATSPYLATASDGTDPGANIDAVLTATAGVAP